VCATPDEHFGGLGFKSLPRNLPFSLRIFVFFFHSFHTNECETIQVRSQQLASRSFSTKLSFCLIKHRILKTCGKQRCSFSTRWRWVISFMARLLLYPQERVPSTCYGGCHSWSGHNGYEKNLCSCWESNPNVLGRSSHCMHKMVAWLVYWEIFVSKQFWPYFKQYMRTEHRQYLLPLYVTVSELVQSSVPVFCCHPLSVLTRPALSQHSLERLWKTARNVSW
jgi:hypothetical protein